LTCPEEFFPEFDLELTLAQELEEMDQQPYELYTYPGDNHNLSANFGIAMQRTVAFFDQYVKGQ